MEISSQPNRNMQGEPEATEALGLLAGGVGVSGPQPLTLLSIRCLRGITPMIQGLSSRGRNKSHNYMYLYVL